MKGVKWFKMQINKLDIFNEHPVVSDGNGWEFISTKDFKERVPSQYVMAAFDKMEWYWHLVVISSQHLSQGREAFLIGFRWRIKAWITKKPSSDKTTVPTWVDTQNPKIVTVECYVFSILNTLTGHRSFHIALKSIM